MLRTINIDLEKDIATAWTNGALSRSEKRAQHALLRSNYSEAIAALQIFLLSPESERNISELIDNLIEGQILTPSEGNNILESGIEGTDREKHRLIAYFDARDTMSKALGLGVISPEEARGLEALSKSQPDDYILRAQGLRHEMDLAVVRGADTIGANDEKSNT